MKIAVIGAGAGGLAALRHCLEEGHSCEVFEKTENIGGTWQYTDKTGVDQYGLPIHSSMYEGLRTNLPKELMTYDGFPYTSPDHSYISQPEVLKYIEDFARAFNLMPHIKFLTHVEKVSPLPNNRWSIGLLDLQTRETIEREYDAVLVCNGRCSVPYTPKLPGIDTFKGTVIHSHDYRNPGPYKGKKVLVIGAGPSGVDIAGIVFNVADKVILCHRSDISAKSKIPEGVIIKPEPIEFKENSVILKDGSVETVNSVIFCTGYSCSYPFLTVDCGIEVDHNWVKYLYKQVINVKHPTMGFIGLPIRIFPFVMFGIQVRFFLSYLKGNVAITKEQMLDDIVVQMSKKAEKGVIPLQLQAHLLGLDQGDYMDDLAETAKIRKIPQVYIKLYKHVHTVTKGNRDLSYRIVDDDEFVQIGK
ncbi:unnamed protein product [Phaedon cochleariae]|uniref:Flavin-containing monooxygenase n=1 Tax=Phaedon cochleariae TaxID=80249 RepID=A0A9N9SKA5_PHACE|nr:unnamed protein product [Phaedon cochleariae]